METLWPNNLNGKEREELVRTTKICLSFLTHLEDRRVLTKSDVEEIKYLKGKSDYSAQRWLYSKLFEDKFAHDILLEALLETNQPTPAGILLNKRKSGNVKASLLYRFSFTIRRAFAAIRQDIYGSNRSTSNTGPLITLLFLNLFAILLSCYPSGVDYYFVTDPFWWIILLAFALIILMPFVYVLNTTQRGRLTSVDVNEADVEFIKGIENLDTYLASSDRKICFVKSENTGLTLQKIRNTMNFFRILETISTIRLLATYLRNVLKFGKKPDKRVVVWQGSLKSRFNINLLLLTYMVKHSALKIVIIYESDNDYIPERDLFLNKDKIINLSDSFLWNQLSLQCQQKLLKQNVVDQGIIRTLDQLVSLYVYYDNEHFLNSFIRGRILIELLSGMSIPVIFRQTIPATRHYVERKLRPRYCISRNIFQTVSENEYFAFEGECLDIDILREIGRKSVGKIGIAKDLLEQGNLKAKFILLEYIRDFEKICRRLPTNSSVHRLKYTESKLAWMETYGNKFEVLQSNICDTDDQEDFSEDEIIDMIFKKEYGSILIICDSPGMGKSVLMASLARKVQKVWKGSLVFYFVMTDFMAGFYEMVEITDSLIQEKFLQCITTSKTGNEEFFMTTSTSFHIFFDGLDELPANMINSALNIFNRIKNLYQKSKLYISTRPNLLHRLESSVSSLGFNIQPFHISDQIQFLTKCWSNVDERQLSPLILKEYTENCISTLRSTLTENGRDITGVPLQCYLVAEVFEEEAIEYSEVKNKRTSKTSHPRISITSIAELFDRMIKRKFEVFRNRHCKNCFHIRPLWNIHLYASTQVIFADDWDIKLQPLILKNEDYYQLKQMCPDVSETLFEFKNGRIPRQEILAIGILEAVDNRKWQFVHRTFAEYFVAKFTVDIVGTNNSNEISTTFVKEAVLATFDEQMMISQSHSILSKANRFKFPVICHFINSIIQIRSLPIFPWQLQDKDCRILTACVLGTFPSLLEILNDNITCHNIDFYNMLLYLAAGFSTEKIFDLLPQKSNMTKHLKPSLLYVAAENGNFDMVSYLINSSQLFIPQDRDSLNEMILLCITDTTYLDPKAVTNREKILSLLLKNRSSLSTERQEFIGRNMLLLQPNVHINLLSLLIDHSDSPEYLLETDSDYRTVLHLSAEYLEQYNYHHLLIIIRKKDELAFKLLVKCRDIFGQTPLNYLMRYLDVSREILQIFWECGAEMISSDNSIYTPLFNAIRYERSTSVVEDLLMYRKENKAGRELDKYNRSPLHIAAQHATNDNLITLLLKHFSVEEMDKYGNIPIFYAVRNPNNSSVFWRAAIFELLKPSNVNHRNRKGETVFEFAKNMKNENSINVLRQLGFTRSS